MPAAFPVFFTCLKALLSKIHMNLGMDFSGERHWQLVSAKTWNFSLYAHVFGSLSLRNTSTLRSDLVRCGVCPGEQAVLLFPFVFAEGSDAGYLINFHTPVLIEQHQIYQAVFFPSWGGSQAIIASIDWSPHSPHLLLAHCVVGSFLCALGSLQSRVMFKGCTAVAMGSTSPLCHGLGFLYLSSHASHSTFYSRSELGF